MSLTPPEGISWLTPYITSVDTAITIPFYENAFNFKLDKTIKDDDGKILHAQMHYQLQSIMIGLQGAYENPAKAPIDDGSLCPISLYVYCEDVDSFYELAMKAGATSLKEPEDMFWGDRMCSLRDLDGYVWNFATHTGNFTEPN